MGITAATTNYPIEYYYYKYSPSYTETYPDPATNDPSYSKEHSYLEIFIPILYTVTFIVGCLGNIFVIIVMSFRKSTRRLVDTFVINLALADLIFVFTLPLWSVFAATDNHWHFGDSLCKLSSYIIAVNKFSSIAFLTCMNVDRYLAVVRLLDTRFVRNRRCILIACVTIWLVSLIMGLPSLIYRYFCSDGESTRKLCLEETHSAFFNAFSLSSLLLMFVVPLTIILFCYGSIYMRLYTCFEMAKVEIKHNNSLKIVFIIVTAFICSWLPFNVFKVIWLMEMTTLSCQGIETVKWGLTCTACFAFFNSCMNPIIYMSLDCHFRLQAVQLLLHAFRNCHKQNRVSSGCSSNSSGTDSMIPFRSRITALSTLYC
ncbi:LOW QUALITY PROTEIN: probable G-protein coupled receptor 25 [Protopterus annectens]|uniref:LOW QUALITY PROTEIN: probable G-protein coupled receptor 25 n=1 Tax=Protopterus annectens TaxID=7888 RepID=UPI001CFA363D|nr:LOW QUALITY PROTEIN: probable G-protein coupled receptor 25 [Protopterus annectens]